LRRCLAEKGETLKVGALLGVIASPDLDDGTVDEFIAGFKPADTLVSQDDPNAGKSEPTEPAARKTEAATEPGEPSPRRIRVSPAAARRARELGVDISRVKSAGRRISPADVERYAQHHQAPEIAAPESTAYEAHVLSATRKSIARKLAEAKQQIPHFYLTIDVQMDAALDRRTEINSDSTQKVSVNDVVMRATVIALQSIPDVNIHLVQDELRRFTQVNLAMAVATEKGIITPVIHKAESLTMVELAREAAALGERARDAALTREDLDGGTFTVSNLGMYGISEFQAIINPPQGAILALGSCEERIVPTAEAFQKANIMRITLSCDHRAIDGALGAQFLSKLKSVLENPVEL
jgi:pyruvate dehydrogenase E2 component (dihydrolipoamide acetyltransferase)